MSLFTDNASKFATTREQHHERVTNQLDNERHAAITNATRLILDGMRGRAQYELTRSVIRQARIVGLGTVALDPGCPCGGRCRQ